MNCERRILEINDFEYRVLVDSLSRRRNELIDEKLPPDDVSDLILKLIDAPVKKKKEKEVEHER